ncbi:ABC transporter permease [Paenibacillus sp. TRM 82003]|nr:ABC transporter permease [Paenibacillus sp. TRM 82003]
MKLEAIWKSRRADYFRAVMPYWRYVMSSGGAAMGFALVLAAHGYATLLQRTRETGALEAWVTIFAGLALTAAVLWNPVRTYAKQADVVFLLPREAGMREYFRGAWRTGATLSGAATAGLLLLYWPLYVAAGGTAVNYALIALFVLLWKALLYVGAWRERRFRYESDRLTFVAAKTAAAAATAIALLGGPLSFEDAIAAVIWTSYAIALRLPPTYTLHWERLLAEERRMVAWHEAWFGFFVDLPHRAESYKPRSVLNGLLQWIGYGRNNAFLYLYWRSFVRSSMFVVALRIVALEALLVWVFPQAWAAAAIYALFCWLLGLQLRGLRAAPAEPLLAAMSPLPADLRIRSQRNVQRTSNIAGTLLMAVPLALVAPPALTAVAAVAGALSAFVFATMRAEAV